MIILWIAIGIMALWLLILSRREIIVRRIYKAEIRSEQLLALLSSCLRGLTVRQDGDEIVIGQYDWGRMELKRSGRGHTLQEAAEDAVDGLAAQYEKEAKERGLRHDAYAMKAKALRDARSGGPIRDALRDIEASERIENPLGNQR